MPISSPLGRSLICLLLFVGVLSSTATTAADNGPFRIQIIDEETNRGVPLVELTTVNQVQFLTDSQGIVAVDEPDLRGQEVFFQIKSHGYEYPADGFGYRGHRLKLVPGGSAVLKIRRKNIAERLYRVTGAGIYRDSVLAGAAVPLKQPLLNGQVLGQDSVLTALYRGKIYWFWGDTNRPSYILGNFHVPGATSLRPSDGGLSPDRGVDLDYFLGKDGFAKETAKLPGEGPTWLDGLTVLRDGANHERMFAGSMKVKNLLEVYRRSIVEWDDELKEWRHAADVPLESPNYPAGNPVEVDGEGGPWIYFGRPLPLSRVKSVPEAFLDVAQYESYTCLQEGTTLDQGKIDRDVRGRIRYSWKRNTPPVPALDQAKLVDRKLISKDEGLIQLRDHQTGEQVLAHAGSTFWNGHRKRWVMIAVQWGGTSMLGEVWYSEAETPLGPWSYAVKIVTHDKYSFYNPKQQPLFDAAGGRRIYFEGTYASTFSGNMDPTPRYDYNQMMYRLDLDDDRTVLPVAVYRCTSESPDGLFGSRRATAAVAGSRESDEELLARLRTDVEFFAPNRPGPGLAPVDFLEQSGAPLEVAGEFPVPQPSKEPAFYLLPADLVDPPPTTVPLYLFRSKTGAKRYSIQPELNEGSSQWTRQPDSVGRVWVNPWRGS